MSKTCLKETKVGLPLAFSLTFIVESNGKLPIALFHKYNQTRDRPNLFVITGVRYNRVAVLAKHDFKK